MCPLRGLNCGMRFSPQACTWGYLLVPATRAELWHAILSPGMHLGLSFVPATRAELRRAILSPDLRLGLPSSCPLRGLSDDLAIAFSDALQ